MQSARAFSASNDPLTAGITNAAITTISATAKIANVHRTIVRRTAATSL
jgi:hypothetical protein